MTQASKTTTWIQEQPRKKYPMPALPPLSSHTQIELGPAGLFSDICVFGCVWPIRRAPHFRIFRGFWKFRTQLCSKLIQIAVATDSLSVSFTISFTRTPPGFSIRAAVAGDNRIPLALAMVQVSHLCWHPAACVQLSKISPGCCGALIVGSTMKIQSKHINWNFQLPDLKGKKQLSNISKWLFTQRSRPVTCDDCWRNHSLGTLSGDLLQLHEPSAAVDPPCDPLAERESDRTEDFKNVGVIWCNDDNDTHCLLWISLDIFGYLIHKSLLDVPVFIRSLA